MIDPQKITEAILETGCPPLALEAGAELVDHWISHNQADAEWMIKGVECGYVCWLDDRTAIIGVQDLLTDENGIVGNEWKTTKEKTRYWDEFKWVESISEGSQVAIYALALREGTYYEKGREPWKPGVARPRIRVRAISKSSPPVIWPSKGETVLTFDDEQLERTRSALLAKAASIRAMRDSGRVPWQLPGIWCENKFRRVCEYYEECSNGRVPVSDGHFDADDPASKLALEHVGDLTRPGLVLLGASAYSAVSECPEKYRRNLIGGNLEESMALATGTVLHSGVASWYKQIRDEQERVGAEQLQK